MRERRISTAAVAALTCIIAGALPVGAADGATDEAVPVTIDVAEFHPTGQTWESTDPRLSGETTCREDRSVTEERGFQVRADDWTVANPDGSWSGVRYGFFSDGGEGNAAYLILEGAGAYEGLTAFLDWGAEPGASRLSGVIVRDDPPLPERSGQRR